MTVQRHPQSRGRTWIPSLVDYDMDKPETFQNTGARVFPPMVSTSAPRLPVLGWLGGCWCGERNGHDWPGKAEGAPHPR